jgi:hypothetical protein
VVERLGYLDLPERVIITAVHCLPFIPPPHPARYLEECTYQNLVGRIGGKQTVWAQCLFADVIADIAVLGQPDNQALYDEADAYDALVDSVHPLAVADAPAQGVELLTIGDRQIERPTAGEAAARVLSLEGQWLDGRVQRRGGCLEFLPHEFSVGGMSGSPIINASGAAIGVISVDMMNPVIADCLSVQIVRSLTRCHSPIL